VNCWASSGRLEPGQRLSPGSELQPEQSKTKTFLRRKNRLSMNSVTHSEHRASSRLSKHEGESSLPYATGSTGLALTVRGSSRRIMIMRFRPANIKLINRRSSLPRLLLALRS
jgi:hypothetical protein